MKSKIQIIQEKRGAYERKRGRRVHINKPSIMDVIEEAPERPGLWTKLKKFFTP